MRTSSMPGSVWEEWFNWKLDDGDALRRFVIRSKWRGVEEERNRESEQRQQYGGRQWAWDAASACAVDAGEPRQEPERDGVDDLHPRLLWPPSLYAWICNVPYSSTSLANSHLSHDHWASVSRELFLQNHSDSYASCATISWTSILMRQRRTCLRNCTCSSFYWTFKSGCSRLTLSKLEPN